MIAKVLHRPMIFRQASGTSRGILKQKDSWFLKLTDHAGHSGIGECSTITKLSPDLLHNLEPRLIEFQNAINSGIKISSDSPLLAGLPALKFCYEVACQDLETEGNKRLYKSDFLQGKGIPINGLVWMGKKSFMYDQIKTLLNTGYNCIKLKIAAIDFEEELSLLSYIRTHFSAAEVEIRVDANGGFSNDTALEKLKRLSSYQLHSIEQPIQQGQAEEMASLCSSSPLAIALDEELISVTDKQEREKLLEEIRPQYIILKPSLLGGFKESSHWISTAERLGIKWWVTSALEANIGLNAIAQWTATLNNPMHQGLGTGKLFSNNLKSPLYIENGHLFTGSQDWGKLEF